MEIGGFIGEFFQLNDRYFWMRILRASRGHISIGKTLGHNMPLWLGHIFSRKNIWTKYALGNPAYTPWQERSSCSIFYITYIALPTFFVLQTYYILETQRIRPHWRRIIRSLPKSTYRYGRKHEHRTKARSIKRTTIQRGPHAKQMASGSHGCVLGDGSRFGWFVGMSRGPKSDTAPFLFGWAPETFHDSTLHNTRWT